MRFQGIDPDTFKPSRRWPSLHLLAEESHYLSLKDKFEKGTKHKSEKNSQNICIYIYIYLFFLIMYVFVFCGDMSKNKKRFVQNKILACRSTW